jgi:hypothetical protein
MITTLPIAHAGHWFEGALYLAPVVILVIVLFVQGRKDDDEDLGPDGTEGSKPAHDANL